MGESGGGGVGGRTYICIHCNFFESYPRDDSCVLKKGKTTNRIHIVIIKGLVVGKFAMDAMGIYIKNIQTD